MLGDGIRERLEALVEEGKNDTVEGRPFAALAVLESGARCGLYLHDEGVGWAMAQGEILAPFQEPKGARAFVEVLEQPRGEFDDAIDRGAIELGFAGDPISFAFPAIDLVRTVLGGRATGAVEPAPRRSAFLCRRALGWLLPSELRDLRVEIAAVADDTSLPTELRDLARRLVVAA
jgi:hypothetical protein